MSTVGRVFTVIRGIFDKRVRDLEWKHPEAVYESAINKRQAHFHKAAEALAGVIASEKRQKQDLTENIRKLEQVEKALEHAITNEDRQRGPQLTKVRRELESNIEADRQKLQETSQTVRELQGTLGQIEKDVKNLKAERADAIAKIRMLQARHDVDALESFGSIEEDKALNGLRERIQQQEIKQDVLKNARASDTVTEDAINDAEFEALCQQKRPAGNPRHDGSRGAIPTALPALTMSQTPQGVFEYASIS